MRIGVIGGNGVAATNLLCNMVEQKITALGAFRDAHHPEMIVWQATSVPSRSMFLEGKGPDWRPDYIRIAQAFKSLGCDIGCMCCNTAHYALDQIEDASGLKFVNLLQEVVLRARDTGMKEFEIFCSDGARKFNLYGNVFAALFPEATIHYPSEANQKLVTEVICAAKQKNRFLSHDAKVSPYNILSKLVEESKHPVILGCTDLRVVFSLGEKLFPNIAVDSLECLADKIVSLWQKLKVI